MTPSETSNLSSAKPPILTLPGIELAVAGVFTLLIVWLHSIVLTHAGAFCRDEIDCVNVAGLPSLKEIWNILPVAESFPALSFLLVRLWLALLGHAETVVRVYGFLVGLAIPAALWFNARSLGRGVPLLSLALFGMNLVAIAEGDSIRAYGIGTLFMLLSVGSVWKLALAPGLPALALAVFSTVAATQAQYQNAFFVLAICAGAIAVTAQQRLWKRAALVLAVGGFAAVCLLPYIPVITQARQYAVVNEAGFSGQQAFGVAVSALNSSGQFMAGVWGALLVIGAGIAVAAQFPKTFGLAETNRPLALYAGVAAGVGWLCFGFYCLASNYEMSLRYFVSPLALTAVFLDTMVAVLPAVKLRRLGVLWLSVVIVIASFPGVWTKCHGRHTNVDAIAAAIAASATKDDLVAVVPWHYGVTFHRYYQGAAPWITVPEFANFEIERDDLLKEKIATPNAAAPALDKIRRVLESGHKLWLVGETASWPRDRELPSLPPAPFALHGWWHVPYRELWGMQVGRLLQSHAVAGRVVMARSRQQFINYENAGLSVFEGWR